MQLRMYINVIALKLSGLAGKMKLAFGIAKGFAKGLRHACLHQPCTASACG
jgi:hypothetical protein